MTLRILNSPRTIYIIDRLKLTCWTCSFLKLLKTKFKFREIEIEMLFLTIKKE